METILLGNNKTEVTYSNIDELREIAKEFCILIGDCVKIGHCATILNDVVIFDNVEIKNFALIKNFAVIDNGAIIGKASTVSAFAYIAKNVHIEKGEVVKTGETITSSQSILIDRYLVKSRIKELADKVYDDSDTDAEYITDWLVSLCMPEPTHTILLGSKETEVTYSSIDELNVIANEYGIKIGDNVVIHDGVTLCEDVTIFDNVVIEKYVYISNDVVIENDVVLAECSVVMPFARINSSTTVESGQVVELSTNMNYYNHGCNRVVKTIDEIWNYIEDKIAKMSNILWDR